MKLIDRFTDFFSKRKKSKESPDQIDRESEYKEFTLPFLKDCFTSIKDIGYDITFVRMWGPTHPRWGVSNITDYNDIVVTMEPNDRIGVQEMGRELKHLSQNLESEGIVIDDIYMKPIGASSTDYFVYQININSEDIFSEIPQITNNLISSCRFRIDLKSKGK